MISFDDMSLSLTMSSITSTCMTKYSIYGSIAELHITGSVWQLMIISMSSSSVRGTTPFPMPIM